MPKPAIIICIVFLFIVHSSWCQPLSFRQFSIGQGLPAYSVLSITQEKKGFIWLGTTDGLCRYDGIRFKTYKRVPDDSLLLSNNNILSLFTDSKGQVWAGTSSGLNKYNEKRDVFENISLNGNRGGHFFCINEDSKGRIWVGGSRGLIRIERAKAIPFNYYARHTVKAVFEDSRGKIWIGAENGVSIIEKRNGKEFLTNLNSIVTSPWVTGIKNITSIVEDANRKIWIGTQNNGAYCFDPTSGNLTSYLSNNNNNYGIINNNVRRIVTDKSKNIWIGTQEGISIINPATGLIHNIAHNSVNKNSLSQNSVHAIFQDNNGSMWVGTYFGGVNLCHTYNTHFSIIQNDDNINSISNNVISSIEEDRKGNLWIATEGGGLNFLNKSTGIFSSFKHNPKDSTSLGSNLIKKIYIDKEDNVWLGTHGGNLNVIIPGTTKFKKYPIDPSEASVREISSIVEDRNQNLWVASNSGVYIFKKAGILLTEGARAGFSISGIARYLYKDKNNDIWIAGSGSLYLFGKSGLKRIDSSSAVNCFWEDISGSSLWMGTNGSGLLQFNTKTKKVLYHKQPFLQSLNILGIIGDADGSLWLSCNKGLAHYLPGNKSYQLYTTADGIAGNEFNYNSFHKAKDGRFYFGGFNGITHFLPAEINKNSFSAPLVFTALKLDNNEVMTNDAKNILKENITGAPKLVFAHNQNVFTIEFALLNYIKSEKNEYLYQLEGFDKTWNETDEGIATYTNLPAGNYKLLVKGVNNDGVWTEPVSLSITVKPPFWLTWWAYIFYAAVAAAIVFIVARFFFLRVLLKKEDELHQAKLNFFTNVSHEIRTHLTLIMAPVERLLNNSSDDGFMYQQLKQVKSNTNRLLGLVGELMDFRKAETDHLQLHPTKQNIIPFLQEIYESFREMSLSKNISTSFMHDFDEIEVNFDERQLEKVFFNLLANAFKFTPEGGVISLHATLKKDMTIITVTDNGHGIAPEYIKNLFTNFFQVADHGLQNTGYGIGLALSKNIVALHKGTIAVESVPAQSNSNGKTIFTVTLPINARLEAAAVLSNAPLPINTLPALVSRFIPIEKQSETEELQLAKKNTILIVEDNTELVQLIKETLTPLYNIITAENGMLGREAAISDIPDLIISDVMMPQMNGFEFCEKIKQDERTSHIPIILLTAKTAQSDQIAGLQQGADMYLTKPFSIKVLELSIQNLLSARERIRKKLTKELVSLHIDGVKESSSPDNLFSNNLDRAFLDKVTFLIDEHIDDPEFGVDMLSRKVAMSAPVLYKKMRALTNMSVNEFIKLKRFKKAAELLAQKRLTVNEVSFAIGYDDRRYFSREFKKYFGVLPSEYNTDITEANINDKND